LPVTAQLYAECVADYLSTFANGKIDASYAKSQGRITFVED